MTPALQLQALRKSYPGSHAVDGVDLEVGTGEIHGLLGRNGAGKTTLLAIILGLVRADAGSIRLLEEPLKFGSGLPAGVSGFIDSPRFPPYLTARAVLRLVADFDAKADLDQISSLMSRVGLSAATDTATGGFSLGMRQRLALAVALIGEPKLLILDEPANGLDPAGVADLEALLRELAANGTAVFVSSHQVATLASWCDAVTILREGRVAFSGTLAELERQAPASSYRLHTSDDAVVLALASELAGVVAHADVAGLIVTASQRDCDSLVLAVGRAGVAVRSMSLQASSLESMFLRLTGSDPGGNDEDTDGRVERGR